jgi:organic radical activating enzyme
LHNGKNQIIDLISFENFLNKFQHRDRMLIITGGECTMHPQFRQILELTKKLKINTQVDTNSIRTATFYNEIGELADVWNITLHPSQHKFDPEKISVLSNKSFVVVYVMMDPEFWELSIQWIDQLKHIKNIKIIPLKIIDNWAGATCIANYTQDQIDFLNNNNHFYTFTDNRIKELTESHKWLTTTHSVLTYEDNKTNELDAYWLIKENLNNFYGWDCLAGNENLMINYDGKVSWANCGIKTFNDFNEVSLSNLTQPIACTRLSCDCVTDIRSTKVKNSNLQGVDIV